MLATPDQRMTCAANACGDWWSKGSLVNQLDWRVVELAEPYRVFGAVAEPPPCPECASGMTTSLRAKIEFAHCDAHGLWLGRTERAAFDELGGWSRVLYSSRR
jgi:hypothetical protein